jgi:L-fuculose-phosphate aldolase
VTQDATRAAVVEAARHLEAVGLNRGTSGNVSVRTPPGFLVTPSGVPPSRMRPADLARCGPNGEPPASGPRPSSEWRLHRDLYAARPDVVAVVHAHPAFATALACLRRPIPAFHYMVAVAGGDDVPLAAYATFGTQALSDAVCVALRDRTACLLANHGLVSVGDSLAAAVARAVEVERLAEQYLHALAVGEPTLLSPDEMARVHERFRDYGRR